MTRLLRLVAFAIACGRNRRSGVHALRRAHGPACAVLALRSGAARGRSRCPRTSRPRSVGHRTTSFRRDSERGGRDRDRRSLSDRLTGPEGRQRFDRPCRLDGRSRPSRFPSLSGLACASSASMRQREVPPATVIHFDVELEGRGVAGQTTGRQRGCRRLEIGRASHRWTRRQRALARGHRRGSDRRSRRMSNRRVRLKAGHSDYRNRGRRSGSVRLSAGPLPMSSSTSAGDSVPRGVLRCPSLMGDNVRPARARRGCAGFRLRHSARRRAASPRKPAVRSRWATHASTASTWSLLAASIALDAADAALARSHVARERGGAVVVRSPDQRIDAGPARDLVEGQELIERLLEQPATLAVTPPAASIRASELLVLRSLTACDATRSHAFRAPTRHAAGAPVIVSDAARRRQAAAVRQRMDAWRLPRVRQRRVRPLLAIDDRRPRAGGAAADRDRHGATAAAAGRAGRR